MIIWLLGAEQPTNYRLAHEAGAKHLGVSFPGLRPRLPKKSDYIVADRFEHPIYLAGGGASLGKMSSDEFNAYMEDLVEFVDLNANSISLMTEPDDDRLDLAYRDRFRKALGDRFAPVWREQTGVQELEALAEAHRTVAIKAESVRGSPVLLARLNPLRARYGTSWHVLDGVRTDELMTGRFQSAATVAWLSPMKYQETIVWDGNRIQRYPKRMMQVARSRHRSVFSRAGFDAAEIIGGNPQETTRFTVWSYLQLENSLTRRKPTDNPFKVIQGGNDEELSTSEPVHETGGSLEDPHDDVDNTPVVSRKETSVPTVRSEPRRTLPGVGFDTQETTDYDENGNPVIVKRNLLKISNVPLRQCDTCHVAANCPAFTPGAECAFELPVEIKTKEQLSAAMAAILEMQAQRVAFMRFQEELNGGYSDANVSAEMDRFFKMTESLKKIEDNREFIKFQVEARGQSGVLSALFGEKAKSLNELDEPIPSNRIIDQMRDS